MKCTVDRDVLTEGIRRTLNVVSSKVTLPVLANVMLEAEENHLWLTTTDLEVSVSTQIPASVEESGATTLPAKKFGQIIGNLSGGEVSMETSEDEQTTLSCKQSFFRIHGLSADEFPREDDLEVAWEFNMPTADFRRCLNKVSYAANEEDSRRALTGILLSLREGMLTAVATDGRRLAMVENALQENVNSDGDVILPGKLVNEMQRAMGTEGDVHITVSEARISFEFGTTRMVSKLIEGVYPNFRNVIPETFAMTAVMPREELLTVLNRVGTVLASDEDALTFQLEDNGMTVSASSAEFGESREPLEISYDGTPVTLAFKPLLLNEPIRHMESDQVILHINDQFSPIQLSGDEGFLCIIMPMHD